MSNRPTRRSFLQQSGAAIGMSALAGAHVRAAQRPETVTLGIIGCGGIMTHHIKGLVRRNSAAEIAWLCDVDPRQIDAISQHLSVYQSTLPKRTQAFEDVLNDRNVDAVIIATPHHWHAPIGLAALQAGKDIYCEKPISHVFNEGPLMIAAAKKYGRIVQHGSQMRSSPVTERAGKLLAEGIIGEVKVARAWTAELRNVLHPVPDTPAPAGVDYDRWLGPAPVRPFNIHRFHQTWRLFYDYGNGEIGDDGIHDLDMAAWGLGVDTMPTQVTARGGRMMLFGHVSEYPDNLTVTYEYADGRLLIYENLPFTSYGMYGFDNGNVFYGTEGYMVFSRRGAFSVFLGPKGKAGPTEGADLRGQRGYDEHMEEFLDSVRTRRPAKATPEIAHRSCALVHLGDIAYRTRGRLEFDPETERFVDAEEANALLTKAYRSGYELPNV